MKKQLSLHLYFDIDIDETILLRDASHEDYEYSARQQRLLVAIMTNPDVFRTYLIYLITAVLDGMSWNDWHDLLLDDDDSTGDRHGILQPALASLSPDDQAWFKEVDDEDIFFENTDGLDDAFSTHLTHFDMLDTTSNNDTENETHV